MNRRTKKIIIYVCISYILAVVYYGVGPNIYSALVSSHYNTNYLTDDLKLLQPIEKKTYTACPNNVMHSVMSIYDEVTLTEIEINRTKLEWQNFVLTVPDYPSNKFSGRGIVSSASSGFNSRRLVAVIKLLRWLKCRLPVEVFMHPGELKGDEIRQFQTISDVTVRILIEDVAPRNKTPNRFAIKPNSILQSSFEHVLWLDSDNIVVRDPEYLFDLPHYTRSTAMFWPDFWSSSGKNVLWKILDIPCRAEDYEQESGQILINKRLAWKALNLAAYFTTDYTISKLIYGDKDTFRLAWKVMGTSFYFIRKFLGLGGFDYVKSEDKDKLERKLNFCGHTMIQHDPFGDILFVHANLVKSYPLTKFPAEKVHSPLKKYINPWRVYRRYANSGPYFRPLLFLDGSHYCMTLLTGESKYLPPLFEDDFHNQVSANITAEYLSYVGGTVIESTVYGTVDVVDRNWTIN